MHLQLLVSFAIAFLSGCVSHRTRLRKHYAVASCVPPGLCLIKRYVLWSAAGSAAQRDKLTAESQDQFILNVSIYHDVGNDTSGKSRPLGWRDLEVLLPIVISGILPGLPEGECDMKFVESGSGISREILIQFVKMLANAEESAKVMVFSILCEMLNQEFFGLFVCEHNLWSLGVGVSATHSASTF